MSKKLLVQLRSRDKSVPATSPWGSVPVLVASPSLTDLKNTPPKIDGESRVTAATSPLTTALAEQEQDATKHHSTAQPLPEHKHTSEPAETPVSSPSRFQDFMTPKPDRTPGYARHNDTPPISHYSNDWNARDIQERGESIEMTQYRPMWIVDRVQELVRDNARLRKELAELEQQVAEFQGTAETQDKSMGKGSTRYQAPWKDSKRTNTPFSGALSSHGMMATSRDTERKEGSKTAATFGQNTDDQWSTQQPYNLDSVGDGGETLRDLGDHRNERPLDGNWRDRPEGNESSNGE